MSDPQAEPTAHGRHATILLSAFGIHIGGGLVLLDALLGAIGPHLKAAALDARMQAGNALPRLQRVQRSFRARVTSLARLARQGERGDTLFCFNGLPPFRRPPPGVRVVCYVHAPHFVGADRGIRYRFMVRLRLSLEKAWFRLGAPNCDEFWVQTPTMAAALRKQRPLASVRVVPFVDDDLFTALAARPDRAGAGARPRRDASFFYPAELVGHKNHPTLVEAWILLAEAGCEPRLQLTLQPQEWALLGAQFPQLSRMDHVVNLGRMPRVDVVRTMRESAALVFPSRAETFGLPLLEAAAHQVPILAAERDFVRDVCEPAQVFDPASARSIADAVLRFLGGDAGRQVRVLSARQLVERLVA
ncbi:MAG: glycosyltransferase [Ramlibacter sp.]